MERANIQTVAEYEYCKNRGAEPLADFRRFTVEPSLRIELQRRIFGRSELSKGDIVKGNQRFYEYAWLVLPHYCEECMRPLPGYSASFISHIISRGGRPDMAHDLRNVNILCVKHHEQWETGNRKKMRIYERNTAIIQRLKLDYQ